MVDSGFIEFKLDYQKTQKLAIGDKLSKSIRAGEHTFTVDCYPCGLTWGSNPGDDLPLHLFLAIKSKNINPIFEAFVAGKDGAPSKSHAKRTESSKTIFGGRNAALCHFLKQSDLKSLWAANGGVVTVVCGVILRHDENPITVPAPNIGFHLQDMMGCTDGSDVSFSVAGETFHAHRAMLAARSPVFKAELFGSMAEAKLPCITVCGIEPSIFKVLLHFIYTDALPEGEELAGSPVDIFQHLIAAADRYMLDRLKLLCAHKLWETVSVDTVSVILTCAETYSCQELKDNCMDYFVAENNFKSAMLTESFAHLVLKFPSIITELRKKAGLDSGVIKLVQVVEK